MSDLEKAAVLARAASIISANGHCKHHLWDEAGRSCIWGALITATTGIRDTADNNTIHATLAWECLNFMDEFLGRRGCYRDVVSPGSHNAISWNNAEERTGEEVASELLAASVELS